MANALKRTLRKGNKVVLTGDVDAEIQTESFGCFPTTSGTAIFVKINGQDYRADGFDIEPEETMAKFAKENGWLDENNNLIPEK